MHILARIKCVLFTRKLYAQVETIRDRNHKNYTSSHNYTIIKHNSNRFDARAETRVAECYILPDPPFCNFRVRRSKNFMQYDKSIDRIWSSKVVKGSVGYTISELMAPTRNFTPQTKIAPRLSEKKHAPNKKVSLFSAKLQNLEAFQTWAYRVRRQMATARSNP